jgi:hypothetical protein
MSLNGVEKNGLQMYRDYQRSFEDHAEKMFAQEVDGEPYATRDLEIVLAHVVGEDARFVPVVACAYADELLRTLFVSVVPKGFHGGKAKLLGPYGPFSDLFKRIQLAHVFQLTSPDLMQDFDRLREARNELSHSWDLERLEGYFTRGRVKDVFPIDMLLHERPDWLPSDLATLDAAQSFRLRVAWLVARLAYEAPLYVRAKDRRLRPERTLYGPNHCKRLSIVSELAMKASREIVGQTGP